MNKIALTFDIDWAPDFMIDSVAEVLAAAGVKSTWFVTHASPALEKLRKRPELFELGIHPNFLPGSTHGSSPQQVLDHCLKLVPKALSMRTHSLVQSTPLLETAILHGGIKADVSLFLPGAIHLEPVPYRWKGRELVRFPYFWEDDFEMEASTPRWDLAAVGVDQPGLKIFNFHPVHLYMNAASMEAYANLKKAGHKIDQLKPADVTPFLNNASGTKTFFLQIVERLKKAGSLRISDLLDQRLAKAV
jgi:hypothetical protein